MAKKFRPTTTTDGLSTMQSTPLGVHTGPMPSRAPSKPTISQLKGLEADRNYQDFMDSGGSELNTL